MAVIKKILSPTDFSETAAAAARKAEDLAKAVGAELLVVHVLNEPAFALAEGSGYAPPSVVEEYEAAMKQKLSAFAEALRHAGTNVSAKVLRGTPHEAIATAAEAEGADLIVMGTHGRTGLSHLLLGSVAERVVRTSKTPVMTVRTP
jgi:nucleotide-binding universal stress UspA family protein